MINNTDCLAQAFKFLRLKHIIPLRVIKPFSPAIEKYLKERLDSGPSSREFLWLKDRISVFSLPQLQVVIQKQASSRIVNFLILAYFVNQYCFFQPFSAGKYETARNLLSFNQFLKTRNEILKSKDLLLSKSKSFAIKEQANSELMQKLTNLFLQWKNHLGFRYMGNTISSCIGSSKEPNQIYLQAMVRKTCIANSYSGTRLIDHFKQATNHAPAIHEVGLMQLQEKKLEEAELSFRKASEQNWAPSMCQLAKLTLQKDETRANEMLIVAGKLGYLQAFFELSELANNLETRIYWLKKAARRNSISAQVKLSKMLLANNKPLARNWITKAARSGCCSAQYMYQKLWTVEKKQLKWLKRSARGGHLHAQHDLGAWYESQNLVNLALEWYRKSFHNGYARANQRIQLLSKARPTEH